MIPSCDKKRYALIGHNIQYSLSPFLHQQFARQTGIALDYELLDCKKNELEKTLRTFQAQGGLGANVTQPFKQHILRYVDEASNAVKISGAANTLLFKKNGIIEAHNTDGLGLVKDLTNHLNVTLNKKHILILGAGGAVAGILKPLLDQQPACLVLANRTLQKALNLAQRFSPYGSIEASDYLSIKKKPFDLIMNGVGEALKVRHALSPHHLHPQTLCYDMTYHQTTPFLKWADSQAVKTINGFGMLVAQAALAFEKWHGVLPDTSTLLFNKLFSKSL